MIDRSNPTVSISSFQEMIPANWYKDEISRILTVIHKRIGVRLYGHAKEGGAGQAAGRGGKPRSSHDAERCEACQAGEDCC